MLSPPPPSPSLVGHREVLSRGSRLRGVAGALLAIPKLHLPAGPGDRPWPMVAETSLDKVSELLVGVTAGKWQGKLIHEAVQCSLGILEREDLGKDRSPSIPH